MYHIRYFCEILVYGKEKKNIGIRTKKRFEKRTEMVILIQAWILYSLLCGGDCFGGIVYLPGCLSLCGEMAQTSPAEFPQNAELPRCLSKVSQQIIRHEGYTVSYNSDYRVANWVAYELTSSEAKSKKNERSNKFVRDPQVKGASAENGDYTRTGYDRGHLAPAGDMKWSAKAMRESFYLSNITPQKPGLNRGVWKDLEEQCRMWATDNGALLIATGPVLTPDLKRLGKNRVAIPKLFYKVICTVQNNRYEAIGFLFENRDYGQISLKDLMIPVDSVEKVTHIDFFPTLPDEVEKRMEASVNKNAWSF